jgi:hypothetical protein
MSQVLVTLVVGSGQLKMHILVKKPKLHECEHWMVHHPFLKTILGFFWDGCPKLQACCWGWKEKKGNFGFSN